MTTNPVLNHLRERLETARVCCHELANEHRRHYSDPTRLVGKVQGLALAISYVDEYLRDPALGTEIEDST